jgi:hypothetical protein
MSRRLPWLVRLLGVVLIVVGNLPFTPLIWLLVLMRGPAPSWLGGMRLAVWQTQAVGAVLAAAGVGLVALSFRKPPTPTP